MRVRLKEQAIRRFPRFNGWRGRVGEMRKPTRGKYLYTEFVYVRWDGQTTWQVWSERLLRKEKVETKV